MYLGLADAFLKMRFPFDSPEAKALNKAIFETIYFASARASCDIAKAEGPFPSFAGCPASKGTSSNRLVSLGGCISRFCSGILSPDMWGVKPSDRWDYPQLRKDIMQYGMRNSLLVAPMPTASTSQILGTDSIPPTLLPWPCVSSLPSCCACSNSIF